MRNAPTLALLLVLVCMLSLHTPAYTQETWTELPTKLSEKRFLGSAVLLQDGRFLLIGGKTSNEVVTASTEIFDPLTNTISSAGKMTTPRWMMGAVLLTNGKVLVIGGQPSALTTDRLSSCDLYDPLTNSWLTTGSLLSARSNFTTTLLQDGRVLITGGNDGNLLSSCEIYDPNTGVWTAIPPLTQGARNAHKATLLPDGRVMVTDGYSNMGRMCEIYDPIANVWLLPPFTMQTRGSGDHTLTLLTNGKLLLAGGWNPALSRAELFDTKTVRWKETRSLLHQRAVHHAVLLPSGNVLISGGIDSHGGDQQEFSLASTEIFSYETETWKEGASLPTPMDGYGTCILPNGQVLIAGGGQKISSSYFRPEKFFDKILIWQDSRPIWQSNSSFIKERTGHTLTLLPNGKAIAVGGSSVCDNTQAIPSCELYNFSSKLWSSAAPLNQARTLHTATLLPNGKIIAVGGKAAATALASVESYDLVADSWTTIAPLTTARFHHTATLLSDGSLLITGGSQDNSTDEKKWDGMASCERYIPSLQRWENIAQLNTKRIGHTATLLPNGNVLVVGGYNTSSGFQLSAELYNPIAKTWTNTTPMATARMFHTATLLPNGKVLIVGGISGNGVVATAELYDYTTNTWSPAGSFPQARYQHTATLLHNGDVLITGGATLSGTDGQQVALATSHLYNTATNAWRETQDLPAPRTASKALLLPDNTVLFSGGATTTPCTVSSSCFLYDVGLGYKQQDRPIISQLSPIKITTTDIAGTGYIALSVQGTGFQDGNRAGSEASNGNYYSSATNYPIVQIRRIGGNQSDNDFVRYLPFDAGNSQWSNTATQVRIEKQWLQEQALPAGYYSLSVIANGIPSLPAYFSIEPSLIATDPVFQNAYTPVTAIAHNHCTTEIIVENGEHFVANDKVLIIQMQGADIDTTESANYGSLLSIGTTGNFEFARIRTVQSNTIVLQASLLQDYDPAGKVQLIKVPEQRSLMLSTTTTCPAWNGKTGGVLVISAEDSLVLHANIDVSGKGFRGGVAVDADVVPSFQVPYYRSPINPSYCAQKGEGIAGYGIPPLTSGRGAAANGGGGGNNHNAGGGGGGNLACGGDGGWAYRGNYSGKLEDAQGLGGHSLPLIAHKVFMGGGGGAGHGNNNQASQLGATDGGNGGGIVIIETKVLMANNHSISANGISSSATEADGTGGGGAGGSILLDIDTYANNVALSAIGGNGGNIVYPGVGPGGGGAGGVIHFTPSTRPNRATVQVDGGKAGRTSSSLYGNSNGCQGDQLSNLDIAINTATTGLTLQALVDTTICLGSSVQLQAIVGEHTGTVTYLWSPITGLNNPTIASPVASPSQTTTYTVTVRDEAGCTASAIVDITVNQCDTLECNTIAGVINSYSEVYALFPSKHSIVVAEPQLFSIGDQVLLIQMQGTQIVTSNTVEYGIISNLGGAGNYEFVTIATINKDTIYVSTPLVRNNYNVDGHLQLVRVPEYDHVTVTDTLTCPPWDGRKGGIIALSANCITMESDITATGKGFRGAEYKDEPGSATYEHSWEYVSDNSFYWAPKGEGIAQYGVFPFLYGKGSPANGGGGGNNHNAGGGGGGNYSAGGNGGFGYQGVPGDVRKPQGMGGKGLATWLSPSAQHLFMGGGGGSGHANHAHGSRGANGGGIAIIRAHTVRNFGNHIISASGMYAPHDTSRINPDGCGGGGAGGTILLDINKVDGSLPLDVTGGNGGSRLYALASSGPGGGGAGGVIVSTKDTTNLSLRVRTDGGKAGKDPRGSVYGATDGANGNMLSSPIIGHFNHTTLGECRGCVPVQRLQQQDCGKTLLVFEDLGYPITSIQLQGPQSSNVVLETIATLPTMYVQASITLIDSTESGAYTIAVRNANNREILLMGTVLPLPVKPVITGNSKELISTPAHSYQWSYNGNPLPNGAQRFYSPLLEGSYTVTITDDKGCSNTSSPFVVAFTDTPTVMQPLVPAIRLYPNPVQKDISISFKGLPTHEINTLEICNILGIVVRTVKTEDVTEGSPVFVSLDGLPAGSYYVSVRLQNQIIVKKFIKN